MTNSHHKTNEIPSTVVHVAGFLPTDSRIEFVSNKSTKKVYFIQNGNVHQFSELTPRDFNVLKERMFSSPKAYAFLQAVTESLDEQVELFTYYMYGDMDSTADLDNGVLAESENFREKIDCPSRAWNCKQLTIDGYVLSSQEIDITDGLLTGDKDAVIAIALGVSHSHLDTLKRRLYKKTNCSGKPEFIKKAVLQKIYLPNEK